MPGRDGSIDGTSGNRRKKRPRPHRLFKIASLVPRTGKALLCMCKAHRPSTRSAPERQVVVHMPFMKFQKDHQREEHANTWAY